MDATTDDAASGDAGTTTVTTDATSCPSYVGAIETILTTYCTSCHGSGGEESDKPLTSYGDVKSLASEIDTQVSSGQMPKGATMTSADEATLLAWISCGAPDN